MMQAGSRGLRRGAWAGSAAAAMVALGLACAASTAQSPGLEVLIESTLPPSSFDHIEVKIQQQTGSGAWGTALLDVTEGVPNPVSLPATVSIKPGSTPDQLALVTVTALLDKQPVVQEVAQVQIPTDRLAELVVQLAPLCLGVLSCGDGKTCQPTTGMCGDDVVQPSQLVAYVPISTGSSGSQDASMVITMGSGGDSGVSASPDATSTTCSPAMQSAISSCTASGGCMTGPCSCSLCPPGSACGGGTCLPLPADAGIPPGNDAGASACNPASYMAMCTAAAYCVGTSAQETNYLMKCTSCGGQPACFGGAAGLAPFCQPCSGGCLAAGSPCSTSNPCCSGGCNAGICTGTGACVPPGAACDATSPCCSGGCNGGICSGAGACMPPGGPCSPTNPCCSGGCSAGICPGSTGCLPVGSGCTAANICCSGTCNAGICMGTVNTCTAGFTLCAGVCTNTQSDNNNCGTCGYACPASETCSAAICQLQCGTKVNCNGTCTDTSIDNNNCGNCGNTCTANEACTGGVCQSTCPTGTTLCNGVCTNTQTDGLNCGSCGNRCQNPYSPSNNAPCSAGVCCGTPGAACCPYNGCFDVMNGMMGCCVNNTCTAVGAACPAVIGGGICAQMGSCVQPDGGGCGGGPMGNACCLGQTCTMGNQICNTTTNYCQSCGYSGGAACPDGTCNSGFNSGGQCVACGGVYQACCPTGSECQSGYTCGDAGTCL